MTKAYFHKYFCQGAESCLKWMLTASKAVKKYGFVTPGVTKPNFSD